MNKVYYFSTTRNKLEGKGLFVNEWKTRLYKGICEKCLHNFDKSRLELEHKIPVKIGGSLILEDNLQLWCNKCHHKKTRNDIIVINILKRLKLLKGNIGNVAFIEIKKLHEIYFYLYALLEEGEENYKKWEWGENGIDYEQILFKENRGKENEIVKKEHNYDYFKEGDKTDGEV